MIFHGHFQRGAHDCLVPLRLPEIDIEGAVQLIDSTGALENHFFSRIALLYGNRPHLHPHRTGFSVLSLRPPICL